MIQTISAARVVRGKTCVHPSKLARLRLNRCFKTRKNFGEAVSLSMFLSFNVFFCAFADAY